MLKDAVLRDSVMYPRIYPWIVLLAGLDAVLTWTILGAGGMEVNPIARWVIEAGAAPGMVAFKFTTVVIVLLSCEAVGRRAVETGRRLASWAVAINSVPVVLGAAQLVFFEGAVGV